MSFGTSSPSAYQSTPAKPDPETLRAAKVANQKREMALADINQDIFAKSQGLRGQSGLYQWAGPTPNMAANMDASNKLGGDPPGPPPKTGGGGGLTGPTLGDIQEKYNPTGEPVPGWGSRTYRDIDPTTLKPTGGWHYNPSLYQRSILWQPGQGGKK